jgi:hypothetical protein
MTALSLSELLEGINQQINSHELLDIHLHEAQALVHVGEASDLDQISKEVIHYYLRALMDILEKVSQLSEHLCAGLCQMAKALKEKQPPESGTKFE